MPASYIARQRDAVERSVVNRLATGDFMGTPSFKSIQGPKGVRGYKRGVKGRSENIRKLYMDVGGIGSYNVELTIAQAFLMPRTTDPDAQATIISIEGLQRAANKVGAQLEVNGILTPETVQTLRKVAGKNWMSKTWAQLYGEFGEIQKRKLSLAPGSGARGFVPTGDSFTTIPLITLLGGAALLVLALK